jgi:glycine oxidase
MARQLSIDVVGAGIFGVWQALTLARAGHRVRLIEAAEAPFSSAQSRFAGARLAPWCEAEAAEPIVRAAGIEGLGIWRSVYPDVMNAGTLVLAQPRDMGELRRFARMAPGHQQIGGGRIAELEPDLGARFSTGLFYPEEAHMATPRALAFLLDAVRKAGAEVLLGQHWQGRTAADLVVDCRGLGARAELPGLRGVRGERLLVRARDVALRRPVRLLHPRYPLYVVPWGEGLHLVGATVIESEDDSAMTMRSALELLGMAYALSPAFGEAEIVELSAGVRPAFPDNVPRAIVRSRMIHVNGAHRHGFLLAPVMARVVADHLAGTSTGDPATADLLRIEPA